MEFVDTNVLLYAYDSAAGDRHNRARELVTRLGRTRSGALSIQVLQEFYVNATQKIARRMDPAQAGRRVRALSRWPLHSPIATDFEAAITISIENRISFWDAMIVRSAAELRCTTLWTEDLNEGPFISGVRITNPFNAT